MTDSIQQNTEKGFIEQGKSTLLSKLAEYSDSEELQKTLGNTSSINSWAKETKGIVENIITSATKVQSISQETAIDIQNKLSTNFTSQFNTRINDLKKAFKNSRQDIESFNLYETQLKDNKVLSVNIDKKSKIFESADLTGLKLTEAGALIAKDINENGEAENVLSVQIKDGDKKLQVGYATDSAIYTPDKEGGFFIASARKLGQNTTMNAAVQTGNTDMAVTAFQIKKENSPLSQQYTAGIVDNNQVIDASLQYQYGKETLKTALGAHEEGAGFKSSYEYTFSENKQFSCNVVATKETAQLQLEYIEKQPSTIHKLSMLLTDRSAQLAYSLESGNNWFLKGSASYDDTRAHAVTARLQTGYSRDF